MEAVLTILPPSPPLALLILCRDVYIPHAAPMIMISKLFSQPAWIINSQLVLLKLYIKEGAVGYQRRMDSSIIAQNMDLATQEFLRIVPHVFPIIRQCDITFNEINPERAFI